MKRCSKKGWGWGEGYLPETGKSCIKHRKADSRTRLGSVVVVAEEGTAQIKAGRWGGRPQLELPQLPVCKFSGVGLSPRASVHS